MGFENLVAKKYAQALFAIAKDLKKLHVIYKELNGFLSEINNNQEIKKLILNKFVPKKVKSVFCNTILQQAQVSNMIQNFVCVLISKKRLFLLKKITLSFKILLDKHDDVKVIEVVLARKTDKKNMEEIKRQLTSYFKSDNLEFSFIVNKKILGGMVIKTGSIMIDLSILSKLYKMQPTIDVSTLKVAGVL